MWAEILLDKDRYENPDDNLLSTLSQPPGGGFGLARELGWFLEGEERPERVVTLKNPLDVLSQPHIVSEDISWVRPAAVKLLIFLFRPLVTGLRKLGITLDKHPAVIITPGFLGRAGIACLLSALRWLGVRGAKLLPRSLAIGLYGAFVLGLQESVSLDSQEDGLTLRRLKGKITEDSAVMALVGSYTAPKAGWPIILENLRNVEPMWSPAALRLVLFGIGANHAPLGISWDALKSLVGAKGGESFRQCLEARITPAASQMGWPRVGLVLAGMCFMVPGAERMTRATLEAGEPFDDSLAVERPSRGVAAMLEWLGARSGRTMELRKEDGVFLSVGAQVHRVISPNVLASLGGRKRTFRRLAVVSVPEGHDREVLGVHIIQGVGDAVQDGVSVGLWTQELDLEGEAFKDELAVTLVLGSSGAPERLRGMVRVHLGQTEEEVPLHFVKSGIVFRS
jgi:hypothetical protein